MKKSSISDIDVQCPKCGHEFPIAEVLTEKIQDEVTKNSQKAEQEFRDKQAKLKKLEQKLQSDYEEKLEKEKADLLKQGEIKEAKLKKLEQKLQSDYEEKLEKDKADLLKQGEKRALSKNKIENERLQESLTMAEQNFKASQNQSRALLREKSDLEKQVANAAIEVQKQVNEELKQQRKEMNKVISERVQEVQENLNDQHKQKMETKEKIIGRLRDDLVKAQNRTELGDSETKGEVMEDSVQRVLEENFRQDGFSPVPKGIRGGDIIQTVRNEENGKECGTILWEVKNTQSWQKSWIAKIQADQRNIKADVAVIVSRTLPDDAQKEGFAFSGNVVITGVQTYVAVTRLLREQLKKTSAAHAVMSGKQDKKELIYNYLTSEDFRHTMKGVVEAFRELSDEITKERTFMEKRWKTREEKLTIVMKNTVGMIGHLQAIGGSSIPKIPELEVDEE